MGRTVKTAERNTDLLAWLIDFRPRPCSRYWLAKNKNFKTVAEPVMTEEQPTAESSTEIVPLPSAEVTAPVPDSTPPLHTFSVGERRKLGFFERMLLPLSAYRRSKLVQTELLAEAVIAFSKSHRRHTGSMDGAAHSGLVSDGGTDAPQKVVLEYPSGVRLFVDADDLSLISELVRL